MKKFLSFLLMSAVLAFTSCSEEKDTLGVDASSDLVEATFSIGLSDATTRAFDESPKGLMRLFIMISMDDKIVHTQSVTDWDQTTKTFDIRLVKGQEYQVAAWADFGDVYYTVSNAIGDAPKVEMNSVNNTGSISHSDAYFAIDNIMFDDAAKAKSLTLKRPFGVVKVSTTFLDADSVANADLQPYMYVREGVTIPTSLSLLDGTVGDEKFVYTTGLCDGEELSFDYIFAEEDAVYYDFTYNYLKSDKITSIVYYDFTNIPVRRNYITNVTGNVLTQSGSLDVTLDQNWEDIYDVDIDNKSGIPDASDNAEKPTVEEEDKTVEVPSITFVKDSDNSDVLRMEMGGIQIPGTVGVSSSDFLKLYGTGHESQNMWVEIDGQQVGFEVINGDDVSDEGSTLDKAKADLVFLVDNSGSMGQEAETLAQQITLWANKLASVMDVKFGCVGYDEYKVAGAINLTTVTLLNEYLNYGSGTSRTKHYGGSDASSLSSAASGYSSYGECGAMALRYAESCFTYRTGANRIYVNLTDEGNQNSSVQWSVESFNKTSSTYDWGVDRGTIHTVWSAGSLYCNGEKPWLMSEYTGGTQLLDAYSDFSNVNLVDLPVTGSILYSYIARLEYTPNLATGVHNVCITIKSADGKVISINSFDTTFAF